ncbi:hypothetical protein ADL26_11130, partial [Thermoactinomyces vulgaris]
PISVLILSQATKVESRISSPDTLKKQLPDDVIETVKKSIALMLGPWHVQEYQVLIETISDDEWSDFKDQLSKSKGIPTLSNALDQFGNFVERLSATMKTVLSLIILLFLLWLFANNKIGLESIRSML